MQDLGLGTEPGLPVTQPRAAFFCFDSYFSRAAEGGQAGSSSGIHFSWREPGLR